MKQEPGGGGRRPLSCFMTSTSRFAPKCSVSLDAMDGRHTPTSQLKQEKLWPLVSISNLLSICWLSARNKALSKVGYEMFSGLALPKCCLCTVGEEWTLTSHEAGSTHQEPSHPWSLVNLSSPFGFAQLRAPQQEEELLCSLECTFSEPCIFPS